MRRFKIHFGKEYHVTTAMVLQGPIGWVIIWAETPEAAELAFLMLHDLTHQILKVEEVDEKGNTLDAARSRDGT